MDIYPELISLENADLAAFGIGRAHALTHGLDQNIGSATCRSELRCDRWRLMRVMLPRPWLFLQAGAQVAAQAAPAATPQNHVMDAAFYVAG